MGTNPHFIGCILSSNQAFGALSGGGGAFIHGSANPNFTNTKFVNNIAAGAGGALIIFDRAKPIFSGCNISYNQALGTNYGGGGAYIQKSHFFTAQTTAKPSLSVIP